MGSPENVPTLNFEGPIRESLFSRFLKLCLTNEWIENFEVEVKSTLAHISSDDERSLVVVGALIVESAIDKLLSAYIPGYKKFEDNKDFPFSMKISLAKSLKLCPCRLLNAADTVRDIRNKFAHDLSVTSFSECKPGHIQSMKDHLKQIDPTQIEGKNNKEIFVGLIKMLFLAFNGYQIHVYKLNDFIRNSDEFRKSFQKYCEDNSGNT